MHASKQGSDTYKAVVQNRATKRDANVNTEILLQIIVTRVKNCR